jgi:predicted transposase YbfD/YdcC
MTVDFPFARSLILLRNERTVKKTSLTTTESHFYLSSAYPEAYKPEQWLALIRGHWGGVEIRNHWRRDVLLGEDRSRSRNPNLLANLALIRNVLLRMLADQYPDVSLTETLECLHSRPGQCFQILCG